MGLAWGKRAHTPATTPKKIAFLAKEVDDLFVRVEIIFGIVSSWKLWSLNRLRRALRVVTRADSLMRTARRVSPKPKHISSTRASAITISSPHFVHSSHFVANSCSKTEHQSIKTNALTWAMLVFKHSLFRNLTIKGKSSSERGLFIVARRQSSTACLEDRSS